MDGRAGASSRQRAAAVFLKERAAATQDTAVTTPIDLKDDGGSGSDELVTGDVRLVVH
jgi:hypothetical protein